MRALLLLLPLLVGCRGRERPSAPIEDDPAARPALPPDRAEALRAIAKEYLSYPYVHSDPAWAPAPCAPTGLWGRDVSGKSRADDASAHGGKLYFLYAKEHDGYRASTGTTRAPSPPGQVIVKEAFWAVEIERREGSWPSYGEIDRDKKRYKTGEKLGLFVMYKLGASAPGTDAGWVYGMVSPGGEVAVEGPDGPCARCHRAAPGDRVFGS